MTLYGRLTRILLMTLAPLGALIAFGLYMFVRGALVARLDDTLDARAEALAAMVESRQGQLEFEFANDAMSPYRAETSDLEEPAYFEIYRLEGGAVAGLVRRSPSLGERQLLADRPAPNLEVRWNTHIRGDTDVRVLARRVSVKVEHEEQPSGPGPESLGKAGGAVQGSTDPEVLVVVAVSREAVDEPLEALLIALLGAGVVCAAAGWASLRWAVLRGLEPVRALAEQVSMVDPSSAGGRLDAERLPAEIAPIQDRINDLLARVEAAMQRERRFTTAAAHELRTPIAELRATLEVFQLRPRSVDEAEQTVSATLVIVERLQGLVAALLRLGRIESGRESAGREEIPLAEAIAMAVQAANRTASARRVSFGADVDGKLSVSCDAALFGMVIGNIIANAAEYADENSRVTIAAISESSGVVVRIANRATGLSDAEAARIGEPFWRADAARAGSDHLGLGMALARAAIAAIGGTVRAFVDRATESLIVELRMPR